MPHSYLLLIAFLKWVPGSVAVAGFFAPYLPTHRGPSLHWFPIAVMPITRKNFYNLKGISEALKRGGNIWVSWLLDMRSHNLFQQAWNILKVSLSLSKIQWTNIKCYSLQNQPVIIAQERQSCWLFQFKTR